MGEAWEQRQGELATKKADHDARRHSVASCESWQVLRCSWPDSCARAIARPFSLGLLAQEPITLQL